MSTQEQIIEHIVLFKVKADADPTKIVAMVDGLNSLASLNLAIHVSAGELLRSISSSLSFTHILHCRFSSKDNLETYSAHPEHIRVATSNVPIVDDIMVVDWVSNSNSASPKPGSAIRVSFLKLKEGVGENEKSKFVELIEGIKNQVKSIEHISYGKDFAEVMAKGYSIASIAVFRGPEDLEAFDSDEELLKSIREKMKDSVESELLVDYVIPVTN